MANLKSEMKDRKRRPQTSAPEPGRRRLSDANGSYLALFRTYPIRPLRSEEDLDQALAVARGLFCRRKPLNRQEQDYLDILTHEIERYEALAYPMPAVSEAAMLRHLMDAHSATLSELAQATTISLSTLSSVLNGKRKLNLVHIRKLAPYFGVEPGVFLD